MVTVSTKYVDGQYHVELNYDSGYRYVGQDFPAGQLVVTPESPGRYQGEIAAARDASDWREKLAAAGLKVQDA
jgi:hypothetical protein